MQTPVAVLIAAVAGLAAGAGIRLLLARLPRGVALRPGVAEVATAAVTAVGVGLIWPGPWVALVVWVGLLGVALGVVDLAAHRLPDALTLPAVPITLLLLGITEYRTPAAGSFLTALVVAVVLTGLFWALAAIAPRAMGLGDVKLVPSLALVTGYASVAASVVAVVIAFAGGAVVAVFGLLLRRLSLNSAIPFGPFLLLGAWTVLVLPGLVTALLG